MKRRKHKKPATTCLLQAPYLSRPPGKPGGVDIHSPQGKQTKKTPNKLLKSKYTSKQPLHNCLRKHTILHMISTLSNIRRSQHLRHPKSHNLRHHFPLDCPGHRADQQLGSSCYRIPKISPDCQHCLSDAAPYSFLKKLQLKAHIPSRIKHLPNSSSSPGPSSLFLTLHFSATQNYQRPSTLFSPVFSSPHRWCFKD